MIAWLKLNWQRATLYIASLVGLAWVLYSARTDAGRQVIARTKASLDELHGHRSEAVTVLGDNAEEVKRIDAEIAKLQRDAVETLHNTKGLTDAQIADRLRDLGF